MQQFLPLRFRPGIVREGTDYSNKGGWYDGDKIRFRNGLPEKIGGWEKLNYITTQISGICRKMLRFSDLLLNIYTILGTNTNVYIEEGQLLKDVTPWRAKSVDLANPINTTNTSSTVGVDDVAHGAIIGDIVHIREADATGGLTADEINGVHTVSAIPTDDQFEFVSAGTATSSVTGGGTGVDVEYIIDEGLADVVTGTGWGAGVWGDGGWGDPGALVIGADTIRVWSFDNFGEDVAMCASDFGVYYWDASAHRDDDTTRAFPLNQLAGADGAPVVARSVIVSERDRHMIAFGCDALDGDGSQDPLLIRWCDQENAADWRPSSTNTAGSLRIGAGSRIVATLQTRQEILIWTDNSLHSMRWIGGNFIFGINLLATNVHVAGLNAPIAGGEAVYWMGDNNFYVYTGQVNTLPCTVRDYVFGDMNGPQRGKIYGAVNTLHSELMWFYPSADSIEIDRYVMFNWAESVWYFGNMVRTAWIDSALASNPIAAATDGFLYYHDIGSVDGETTPSSQIMAHVEGSMQELGEGRRFTFIDRLIPDITFRASTANNPTVEMVFTNRRAPGGSVDETVTSPIVQGSVVTVEEFTEEVWMRLRGREFIFRVQDKATVETEDIDVAWRLGVPRIQVRTDGRQ